MEKETIFADGFIWKKPRENAPDFVLGSISIKGDEAIEFIKKNLNNGWVNLDVLKSTKGNIYMKLNVWKPEQSDEAVNKKFAEMDTKTSETEEGDVLDTENIPF